MVSLEQIKNSQYTSNGNSSPLPPYPGDLLTLSQARILRLLYEEGATVGEAAMDLDIEEQTVRSMKHKALKRLRHYFKV